MSKLGGECDEPRTGSSNQTFPDEWPPCYHRVHLFSSSLALFTKHLCKLSGNISGGILRHTWHNYRDTAWHGTEFKLFSNLCHSGKMLVRCVELHPVPVIAWDRQIRSRTEVLSHCGSTLKSQVKFGKYPGTMDSISSHGGEEYFHPVSQKVSFETVKIRKNKWLWKSVGKRIEQRAAPVGWWRWDNRGIENILAKNLILNECRRPLQWPHAVLAAEQKSPVSLK